jgi:hypothetical protein
MAARSSSRNERLPNSEIAWFVVERSGNGFSAGLDYNSARQRGGKQVQFVAFLNITEFDIGYY